jgi:hypothetical protein
MDLGSPSRALGPGGFNRGRAQLPPGALTGLSVALRLLLREMLRAMLLADRRPARIVAQPLTRVQPVSLPGVVQREIDGRTCPESPDPVRGLADLDAVCLQSLAHRALRLLAVVGPVGHRFLWCPSFSRSLSPRIAIRIGTMRRCTTAALTPISVLGGLRAIPDSHLMRDSDGVFDHAVASGSPAPGDLNGLCRSTWRRPPTRHPFRTRCQSQPSRGPVPVLDPGPHSPECVPRVSQHRRSQVDSSSKCLKYLALPTGFEPVFQP